MFPRINDNAVGFRQSQAMDSGPTDRIIGFRMKLLDTNRNDKSFELHKLKYSANKFNTSVAKFG